MAAYDRERWAELATRGILSRREREKARQELLDHMEDHAAALESAGHSPERAALEAVAAMGDPSLTARLLRQAHQPVLTRMLQGCRWAALFLAAVLVLTLLDTADWREMRRYQRAFADHRQVLEQQLPELAAAEGYTGVQILARPRNTLRVGDYTFSTDGVWMLERSDGTWQSHWLLEARPHRPWQDPPQFEHLFRMDAGAETDIRILGDSVFRQVGGRYSFELILPTRQQPKTFTWEYVDPEGGFVYTVELEGGEAREETR